MPINQSVPQLDWGSILQLHPQQVVAAVGAAAARHRPGGSRWSGTEEGEESVRA
jgi:hypothetical protein